MKQVKCQSDVLYPAIYTTGVLIETCYYKIWTYDVKRLLNIGNISNSAAYQKKHVYFTSTQKSLIHVYLSNNIYLPSTRPSMKQSLSLSPFKVSYTVCIFICKLVHLCVFILLLSLSSSSFFSFYGVNTLSINYNGSLRKL